MSESKNAIPWLTIVGLGEDGPDGLSPATRAALESAEVVMGAARHLALLSDLRAETVTWPVPYADGLPLLMGYRGRPTVVLASGDPFWFGAGSVITRDLTPGEWRAFPGVSTFALAASRIGWPLEQTACLGLHAAPFTRLRPQLAPGERAIVLLRDGDAVGTLAHWLTEQGFGATTMTVMEALGGPRERIREITAAAYDLKDVQHPVCAALAFAGEGGVLTHASGLPDDWFANDGQITKRPVRALTLSALAPRPGEHLWDIGAGSGSIALEWLLAHPTTRATAIEADPERAARISENAETLGVAHRLTVVEGAAPDALTGLADPDAVFIGGGLSEALLTVVWQDMAPATRLVANAVTLDSEALLTDWQGSHGGTLLRIELAQAASLGRKRGWKSSYPIVQWSVTR